MLEKLPYGSGFALLCDTCSNYEEFEAGNNWKDFIADSKELGWRFKQNKYDEWEHYCPVCVEKYKEVIEDEKA